MWLTSSYCDLWYQNEITSVFVGLLAVHSVNNMKLLVRPCLFIYRTNVAHSATHPNSRQQSRSGKWRRCLSHKSRTLWWGSFHFIIFLHQVLLEVWYKRGQEGVFICCNKQMQLVSCQFQFSHLKWQTFAVMWNIISSCMCVVVVASWSRLNIFQSQ
jgi:hypothetical protein